MEKIYTTQDLFQEIDVPTKRKLQVSQSNLFKHCLLLKEGILVWEICDGLLQKYYWLEEAIKSLDKTTKDKIFARWIIHLSKVTGPIRREGIQELLNSIPDIPWEWIEQTDSQLRDEGATEAMLEERRKEQENLEDDSELER